MTTENSQAFSKKAFLSFLRGGQRVALWHNYFFSVKQNVKDIFIDGHRRKEKKEKVIFRNRLKKVEL